MTQNRRDVQDLLATRGHLPLTWASLWEVLDKILFPAFIKCGQEASPEARIVALEQRISALERDKHADSSPAMRGR